MITNEEGIILSSSEPVKNRRKIWLKKGKNLYNGIYSDAHGYSESTGSMISVTSVFSSMTIIKIPDNSTNLACSKNGTAISARFFFYDSNRKFLSSNTTTQGIVAIPENAEYCHFQVEKSTVNSSMSQIQVETESITSYEAYIKPTIYLKNKNDKYEEFKTDEETTQRLYSFKGFQILVMKIGRVVTITTSGSLTEKLSANDFYDIQLDEVFKPLVEINDSFACSPTEEGMARITKAGILRFYPWVDIANTRAMRYCVTYISAK